MRRDLWTSLKKRNISFFKIAYYSEGKNTNIYVRWLQCFRPYGIGIVGSIYPSSIFGCCTQRLCKSPYTVQCTLMISKEVYRLEIEVRIGTSSDGP